MKIDELIADKRNANKGTKRGADAVAKSLRDYGAGRSVLVDRNGNVLAGNQTVKAASAAGLDQNVILVETDGSQLVVVKRTDLDLDDPKARALAIADIVAADAFAYTVTTPTNGINASKHIATWTAAVGNSLCLVAYGGSWYTNGSPSGVTLS
jgi:hypothetical protein